MLGTAGLDYRLTDSGKVYSLTRIEALCILYIHVHCIKTCNDMQPDTLRTTTDK
jgi:hypothetical protein